MASINYKYFFSIPPIEAWEYIANGELIEKWIMKNNFMPFVGVDFQFRTNPFAALNFDGIFDCKVLAVIPFQQLAYSWKTKSEKCDFLLNTKVLWQLRAKNEGTEISLYHYGFVKSNDLNMYDALSDSWLRSFHLLDQLIKLTDYYKMFSMN